MSKLTKEELYEALTTSIDDYVKAVLDKDNGCPLCVVRSNGLCPVLGKVTCRSLMTEGALFAGKAATKLRKETL